MPSGPRMRPRFERETGSPPDVVMRRLEEALRVAGPAVEGRIVGHHVHLRLGETHRTYWSPHLWVDVYSSQAGSIVRGLFGPHPSVWTLFMAAYAVIGFAALVGVAFGYSQWTLDQPAVALWSLPAAAVAVLCVFALALHGQRLSRDQMDQLLQVVETAMT